MFAGVSARSGSAHQVYAVVSVSVATCLSHSFFNSPESLENRRIVVATRERWPYSLDDCGMNEFSRERSCSSVIREHPFILQRRWPASREDEPTIASVSSWLRQKPADAFPPSVIC